MIDRQVKVDLAHAVRAIKDRRGITYSKIASECGIASGERIMGLVNCHALRDELVPAVQAWVRKNS